MNNDLISREALKEALKSNCDLCNDKNTNWCEHCCPLNDFEDLIDNAPTVEAPTELCGDCRFLKDCETCEEKLRPQDKCENCMTCVHHIDDVCEHCYESNVNWCTGYRSVGDNNDVS